MVDDTPGDDSGDWSGRSQPTMVIGVTGHRPGRLHDTDLGLLQERANTVLTEAYAAVPSGAITVLSPLAEGVDQLVARVALSVGCQLVCPLPFPVDVYVNDFATAAARAEYRALLALATQVVELDGCRTPVEARDAAYAAVGDYIIDRSDLLLAVWDGEEARGRGGTGQVVAAAIAAHLPVIWIAASRPHHMQFITPAATRDRSNAAEASIVDRVLRRISPT